MFVKFYASENSLYLDVLKAHEKDVNSKPLFEGFSPNPVVGFLYEDILDVVQDHDPKLLFDPHQHRLDDDILYATSPYGYINYNECTTNDSLNFIYGLEYLNETHIFGHLKGPKADELDENVLGSFIRRVLKYRCLSNSLFGITYRVTPLETYVKNHIPDNVLSIADCISSKRKSWQDMEMDIIDILQKTENLVKKMEGF